MRVLTLRELNRATLARQLLLKRASLSIIDATEQLGGLQAQIPNPPYIGLWTRLENIARDDLTRVMEERGIVRAAMMRSTLHLVTAADHRRFRPVIEPALIKGLRSFFGKRGKNLDIDRLVSAARPFLEDAPRSTGELREFLLAIEPDQDGNALAYAVRTYLPLVQVPPGGTWGAGSSATYTTADVWLGTTDSPGTLSDLFFRYLEAFGPASIMDFQTWMGMTRLKGELEPLRDELVTYADENGRELFDLPDMPLPSADTPARVRLIPEYDNLLIAHRDRNRIIADADRKKVFLSAGRVLGTVLVDGFVRGTWKLAPSGDISVSPFEPFDDETQNALIAEIERLKTFVNEPTI